MSTLEYIEFSELNSNDFIPLLNNQRTREYLIEHELFDSDNVKVWIESKI